MPIAEFAWHRTNVAKHLATLPASDRAVAAASPRQGAAGETLLSVLVSALLLLWPAAWNSYPLVFADTGTYLSQAVHQYIGWDRPVFYSLFLLPLHLTTTLWPPIALQALISAWVLHLGRRTLAPAASAWSLVPLTACLAAGTAWPWIAAQLMPDLFTPLLVLALTLLVLCPERLSGCERLALVALAGFAIAAQQSSMPLAAGLLMIVSPLRQRLGGSTPLGRAGIFRLAAAPLLAVAALLVTNLAGHHRLALSPYGNVFLLARVIYDGPGLRVLQRDCPRAEWRLCAALSQFPASSDEFLWRPDSPVMRVGGHKAVSAEADAIIRDALRAEPLTELAAFLRNGMRQLGKFATGDELGPYPKTVEPWILRDFPAAEIARYTAARQTHNALAVPAWLQTLHAAAAVAGVIACAGYVLAHPHRLAAGFAAAVLLAIIGNALIAGGLSAPHHRYGARTMLLAPTIALLGGMALRPNRGAAA